MSLKTYKAVVSFGDGKPKETFITAKNGAEAADLLFLSHPGARNVYLHGSAFNSVQTTTTTIDDPVIKQNNGSSLTFNSTKRVISKQRLIKEVVDCRRNGASYEEIAIKFKVNKGTARNWVSNANKLQQQTHV
jgi:hypothetical protein